jgi:hypothetical protein
MVLSLFLTICLAAPTLHAEQAEDTADQSEAATNAETDQANDGETAEKKMGPSFLPIPIFITEPAIGYGLGAALGYFHKRKDQDDTGAGSHPPGFTADTAAEVGNQQKVPPTVSGIAAAYTEKGTWGVGVAHSASWKKDRIRYKGALGYAHIVSTFYFNNQPFDFELDTGLFYQDMKFRIASSDFFVGGKLIYLTPDLLFEDDLEEIPEVSDRSERNDFGLALQADWDSRDNKMTPNRGQFVEFIAWKHLEVLSGETDYWTVGLQAQSFTELAHGKLVLGFHLDLDTAGGDPPIWGYPWVTMRGIPALRYQNESTGVLETELRWNLVERWAVVGFMGVAATRGDVSVFEDENGIFAGGIGGRFLFRPQDSLWVGIDLAKGPEDYVVYVQIGQAW